MNIVLKHKEELSDSGCFEFNISGTVDQYQHWAADSRYLEEEEFAVVSAIFEKNSPGFNYYGSTLFSHQQLEKIKDELVKTGFQPGEPGSLISLFDLVEYCLSRQQVLWVLGL
jgi:hypothetical protein